MQVLVECLPIFSGIVIAAFARVVKWPVAKLACVILLPVVSGIVVNVISREGSGLVWADIFMSFTGCLIFTVVYKYSGRIYSYIKYSH